MDEQKREEYFARREEEWQRKQDRWRLTAGLAEFLAVVGGVAACLVLVLLIASLVSWLRQDAAGTFAVFINMFKQ